jgi:hypothetical protein
MQHERLATTAATLNGKDRTTRGQRIVRPLSNGKDFISGHLELSVVNCIDFAPLADTLKIQLVIRFWGYFWYLVRRRHSFFSLLLRDCCLRLLLAAVTATDAALSESTLRCGSRSSSISYVDDDAA